MERISGRGSSLAAVIVARHFRLREEFQVFRHLLYYLSHLKVYIVILKVELKRSLKKIFKFPGGSPVKILPAVQKSEEMQV